MRNITINTKYQALLIIVIIIITVITPIVSAQEPSPSPSPETSASPQPSQLPKPSAPLPEEQAIYNLNKGLLPTEVQGKESSIEDTGLLGIIKNLFQAITGFFNNALFFAQSESIHRAEIPQEVNTESDSPIDKLKNFLGGSSGIYGVNLPNELQNQDIRQSEKSFEKANFPEGINPVTGP